jgi:hypothetical protein
LIQFKKEMGRVLKRCRIENKTKEVYYFHDWYECAPGPPPLDPDIFTEEQNKQYRDSPFFGNSSEIPKKDLENCRGIPRPCRIVGKKFFSSKADALEWLVKEIVGEFEKAGMQWLADQLHYLVRLEHGFKIYNKDQKEILLYGIVSYDQTKQIKIEE